MKKLLYIFLFLISLFANGQERFVRSQNAARTSTLNTTAADITYDTAVLSETGYSWSSPEVTVTDAGKYLYIGDLGQVDLASTRSVGTHAPAINGTIQTPVGLASDRYLRNSGGAEGTSMGVGFLNLSASDAVKVRNPGNAYNSSHLIDHLGSYATRAGLGGGLQLLKFPDGNFLDLRRNNTNAAEPGVSNINATRPWINTSGTWGKLSWPTEVSDDDSWFTSGTDITLPANKKYLIVWSASHYSTDGSRHTYVTGLNVDGDRVQTASAYQRNTASQGPPMNGMYLHEVDGTADIVYLEATQESEGGDAGTPQFRNGAIQILELPDTAEWIHVDNGAANSLTTALAGTGTWYDTPLSATFRADGNSNFSLDAVNDAVQNDSGESKPVLAIGQHGWDRDSGASGVRKMPWAVFNVSGTRLQYGMDGAYSRGQQGSDDTFQAHYVSSATFDVPDGADIIYQVNEPASGANSDMGIYGLTNRHLLGVQVLDLSTLETTPPPTTVNDLRLGSDTSDAIYLGSTVVNKVYLGSDLVYDTGNVSIFYTNAGRAEEYGLKTWNWNDVTIDDSVQSEQYFNTLAVDSDGVTDRVNNDSGNGDRIEFYVDPSGASGEIRAEIRTDPWAVRLALGAEEWFGTKVVFPSGFISDTESNWLFIQNKDESLVDSPAFSLWLSNDDGGRNAGELYAVNNLDATVYSATGITPVANTVLDVVCNVLYHETAGIIKWWVNGSLVYDYTGRTVYAANPWGGNWKLGIYAFDWEEPAHVAASSGIGIDDRTLYMEGFRIITKEVGDPTIGDDEYSKVFPGSTETYAGGSTILIADQPDDAVEAIDGSGTSSIFGSELLLAHDGFWRTETGLRFPKSKVSIGHTVTNAQIQFTAFNADSGTVPLIIYGELATSSAAFDGTSGEVSSRTKTTASVAWSPPSWNADDRTSAQLTPDLSSIVQEIIDQPGYNNQEPITFIITTAAPDVNKRSAYAYKSGTASDAPELTVTFN